MSEAFIQGGDKVTCRNGHRIGVIAGDALVMGMTCDGEPFCPLCRAPWWRFTDGGSEYHVEGRGWVDANPPTPESPTCPTAAAVAAKIADRADVGLRKYGTTLAGAGLSRRELLVHAQEEALDLAVYLQRLIEMEDES